MSIRGRASRAAYAETMGHGDPAAERKACGTQRNQRDSAITAAVTVEIDRGIVTGHGAVDHGTGIGHRKCGARPEHRQGSGVPSISRKPVDTTEGRQIYADQSDRTVGFTQTKSGNHGSGLGKRSDRRKVNP